MTRQQRSPDVAIVTNEILCWRDICRETPSATEFREAFDRPIASMLVTARRERAPQQHNRFGGHGSTLRSRAGTYPLVQLVGDATDVQFHGTNLVP